MNTLFPIFIDLTGKTCTVIGGGTVALRKIRGLLDCQATVRVVSPASVSPIRDLHQAQQLTLHERAYQPADLNGSFLVVAATNDAAVNTQIYQECTALHILCNVVDKPELCNFYYASVYTQGDLKIAISTNGISPALARRIKAQLADLYPDEFTPYLKYLRGIREVVKMTIPEESQRKAILEKIVSDPSLRTQCKDGQFCQAIDTLDFFKELEKWL
ncbi:bifunctional precorrin-2 dehydrogenase/sirohydrochlorin ferrochelatase [candidate division KSB3 bacterium]|uniref:precorrin-2 dehydrogenase n=1 Tax=candidate division KSB3 bacterium TaxID=2044937 RepID=A0A9D5JZ64_9BACT|nr:bifunctional precorrin-2 dehydrogenase/sirohydrochlorin ferrochelatase [candidate division KSB3 bacterium]MBD3326918.1 bifunctional precorrin-2 dehydrogenase/sirohydrochlorin ferrochelatase [candidate division KSB3 bacterium]